MRAKILNRAGDVPSDGWYQIEVTGTHPAGKARTQVIDQVALESIVNRFTAERTAAGENFAGMLVDNDHLSHDLDNSTEALAWAQELAIRAGQLHARLDLTDLGDVAIRNKRFKFFSTEYDPEDLQDLSGGAVRPLRLSGLAFTNRPNNRGGKPISNRDGTQPGGDKKPDTNTTMQPIALKLGLPADADEAAILTKLADLMSELETLKGKDASAQADVIMNRYGERIPKDKREDVKKRLIANRADTEAMLDLLPEPMKKAEARIFNRSDAKQPDTVTDEDKVQDGKKAAAIRNRANSISREQNIPFNRAFGLAQAELS